MIRSREVRWSLLLAALGVIFLFVAPQIFELFTIINLTTVLADGPGHATVYPCTPDVPQSSAANYQAGGVDANEVIAKLSGTGTLQDILSDVSELRILSAEFSPTIIGDAVGSIICVDNIRATSGPIPTEAVSWGHLKSGF